MSNIVETQILIEKIKEHLKTGKINCSSHQNENDCMWWVGYSFISNPRMEVDIYYKRDCHIKLKPNASWHNNTIFNSKITEEIGAELHTLWVKAAERMKKEEYQNFILYKE